MKDTYVSFTTHEARVRKIGPMLSSVLDQWPADRVLLTVAHNLELPDFLKDSVKIYVVPYSKEEHHETFGRPKALEYAKEHSLWRTERANDYSSWDTALRNHRSEILRRI